MKLYRGKSKSEIAEIAKKHTKEMESKYAKEILYSSRNSISFWIDNKRKSIKPHIFLENSDTVSAIIKYAKKGLYGKIAVLNFASYKRSGGGFLKGNLGQEESLCHESFLYNVLKRHANYYKYNKYTINDGFYTSNLLYSPDIIFERGGYLVKADVITCSAPNKKAIISNDVFDEALYLNTLHNRICRIIGAAEAFQVDTLILGAFGCGVFGNDPSQIAEVFNHWCNTSAIPNIVFAIPNEESINYKAFERVFSDYL